MTYSRPVMVYGVCLIFSSDGARIETVTMISAVEEVMDEMIVELDKQVHALGVLQLWLEGGIRMGHDSLAECIDGNNTVYVVVDVMRTDTIIRGELFQAVTCKAGIDIHDNVVVHLAGCPNNLTVGIWGVGDKGCATNFVNGHKKGFRVCQVVDSSL